MRDRASHACLPAKGGQPEPDPHPGSPAEPDWHELTEWLREAGCEHASSAVDSRRPAMTPHCTFSSLFVPLMVPPKNAYLQGIVA